MSFLRLELDYYRFGGVFLRFELDYYSFWVSFFSGRVGDVFFI